MVFPAFGGGAYGSNGTPAWGSANGSWFTYYLPGATRDYAAEAGDLWRNSAVAACLGWISDNFSEPTIEVVRCKRGGVKEPVDDHDFTKRMREPNDDYDADALWAATVLSFVISGNAYWIKCKTAAGRPEQLYWAPYWEIEPRWSATGSQFIDHYDHVVDGKRYPLRREDVVHFRRGLNPTNVRSGLPMLEPVLREIVSDNAANTYVAAILKNMGIPGVIMMPEDNTTVIDGDDAKDIQSLWVERTSGDNVGKPLVTSVRMKIQELTLSPEKLTLDKIRKIPEARICAAFRLPAMVVGLSVGEEQKTYANMAVAERMAYRNCLIPMQKCFAKTLTRQLLPDLGGIPGKEYVRWNYSEVEAMSDEKDAVAKRSVILFTGGVASQEEARSMNGLGPAKPGDTFAKPKQAGDKTSDKEGATNSDGDESKSVAAVGSGFGLETKALVRLTDPDEADARKMLAVAARKAGVTLHAGPLTDDEGHKVLEALIDLAQFKLKADAAALMAALTPEPKSLVADAVAKVKAWKDATAKFLRKLFLAGALALADPLGAPEITAVNVAHQGQVQFLDQRAAAIIDGSQPLDGTLPARAAQYGSAAWGIAEDTKRVRMAAMGMLWEYSELELEAHHCDECLTENERGWQPIGTLVPIGERECKSGCRCWFRYSATDPNATGVAA